jgi:hypothetical protein
MKLFRTAIALLIGLTAASTAAQQATSVIPPTEAPAQKGSDGVQDGIKLHGNWVLDVRNPDGTLVRHSEFKNSLLATGQAGLAKLLGGLPFSRWMVTFNESNVLNVPETLPDLCQALVLQAGIGAILVSDPSHISGDGLCFWSTLSVSAPGNQLVMTGSFTVTHAGQIQRVVTHLGTQGGDNRFTMATLPTPLPVAQGQLVQFTYTLSFS